MDPFFGGQWNYPSRRRYYSPPSPTQTQTVRVPDRRQPSAPPRKVVHIPVHHVGSERSKSDSALKIQKVFRGFLVRKSLKKITAIRREVDEIEKRLSLKENVELIRRDSMERLKLNEMLMSLLFKLDTVRGFDSGVRECRKAVIKKAIALQEMIDSCVASDPTDGGAPAPDHIETADDSIEDPPQNPENQGKSIELQNHVESMLLPNDPRANSIEAAMIPAAVEETSKSEAPDQSDVAREESVGTSPTESQADSSASTNSQTTVETDGEDDSLQKDETAMEITQAEQKEESKRSRLLLERLMEDNEKMMELMAELYERNEMQTRLLCSLSQRVEHLERALLCSIRKKKKNNAAALVDCLESTQDHTKSGKKM